MHFFPLTVPHILTSAEKSRLTPPISHHSASPIPSEVINENCNTILNWMCLWVFYSLYIFISFPSWKLPPLWRFFPPFRRGNSNLQFLACPTVTAPKFQGGAGEPDEAHRLHLGFISSKIVLSSQRCQRRQGNSASTALSTVAGRWWCQERRRRSLDQRVLRTRDDFSALFSTALFTPQLESELPLVPSVCEDTGDKGGTGGRAEH